MKHILSENMRRFGTKNLVTENTRLKGLIFNKDAEIVREKNRSTDFRLVFTRDNLIGTKSVLNKLDAAAELTPNTEYEFELEYNLDNLKYDIEFKRKVNFIKFKLLKFSESSKNLLNDPISQNRVKKLKSELYNILSRRY